MGGGGGGAGGRGAALRRHDARQFALCTLLQTGRVPPACSSRRALHPLRVGRRRPQYRVGFESAPRRAHPLADGQAPASLRLHPPLRLQEVVTEEPSASEDVVLLPFADGLVCVPSISPAGAGDRGAVDQRGRCSADEVPRQLHAGQPRGPHLWRRQVVPGACVGLGAGAAGAAQEVVWARLAQGSGSVVRAGQRTPCSPAPAQRPPHLGPPPAATTLPACSS